MSKYRFEIKATEENNLNKIGKSIEHFADQILLMSLTRDQTNQIFKLTEAVVETYNEVVQSVAPQSETLFLNNLNMFQERLKSTLETHNSDYKRKKKIEKNVGYVSPIEKAIGYEWVQSVEENTGKIIRKYQQNTFQFIPPSATIGALFSNPDFVKLYLESVTKKDHKCKKGVYRDFCCSSRGKEFLKENPNGLLVQLYQDDFEPCDALKSKAGKHKVCAFYMIIRNMPLKLQSKLSNIYLVALASSSDFKNESCSIENVLEVIIEDFKMLSKIGITTINGEIIKCFLISLCFDNLGANYCYGLVQSFKANYFCRFCEMHQNECKLLTKEDSSKLRKIETYNKMCSRIQTEGNLDLTETKGIRKYCVLNDISNFHIFKNYSVDSMHDLLEGAVPFTLHIIFDYCFENKLFNLCELDNMIQFYNYGLQNKLNVPSKLRLKAKNLGQSATQLYCLILNVPFILNQYKNKLTDVWVLVQTLLHILEIVSSEEIRENDLKRLESTIEKHTTFIVDVLKKDLIPKHHILLHYPRVIRAMGPPVFTATMRFEAKHQELKSIAQKTKNFINLNKTISEKHQMLMSLRENLFCDDIEPGKVTEPFDNTDEYEIYKSCTQFQLKGNELLIKFLKVNSLIFKPGLLLLHNSIFLEISKILQCSTGYWFLCDDSFKVKELDLFSNSLVLEKTNQSNHVLNLNQLSNMKPYQKIFIQGKIHVICENLDFLKLIPK